MEKNLKKNLCALFPAILFFFIAGAHAAPKRIRITRMSDFTFSNMSIGQTYSQEISPCVYTTSVTGRYNVTVTGNGPGSSFNLVDGALPTPNQLPYTIYWRDSSGWSQLQSGVSKSAQGANTNDQFCAAAPPLNPAGLRVSITVPSSQRASTYTGTIVVLVSPI